MSASLRLGFSFCVYGDSKKYCHGMIENIDIITTHFPQAMIYIYLYYNVPMSYVEQYESHNNVCIKKTSRFYQPNMFERFFLLEDEPTIDVMIVRDADSRIHHRDGFCIHHFIASPFQIHTIRDHMYHHAPIMGGLWGMKRMSNIHIKDMFDKFEKHIPNVVQSYAEYRFDMNFLQHCLYPEISSYLIVYVCDPRLRINTAETLFMIPFKVVDQDFCGQVIIYDSNNNAIKEFSHPF